MWEEVGKGKRWRGRGRGAVLVRHDPKQGGCTCTRVLLLLITELMHFLRHPKLEAQLSSSLVPRTSQNEVVWEQDHRYY